MILLIDNYDSFTYNLMDSIRQSGVDCDVARNDAISLEQIRERNYEGIVISPGPKRPVAAGVSMEVIAQFHRDVPILGVCLGHQGLGEYFGAKLIKAPSPVHGKTAQVIHSGHWIFNQIPEQFEVMRYHSLVLMDVEHTELQVIAATSDGIIMGVAHPQFPVVGVQFHPESILTPHGNRIMKNWLDKVVTISK